MKNHFDVVIVGGGHGGAQVAATLRQLKFEGSIAIFCDEPELPYERPPLSKEYLAGDKEFERILIRPDQFWSDREVTLKLGQRVTGVDPDAHTIATQSGETWSYGKLVWATGGSPRKLPLPGGDFKNVFGIRTKADTDAIKTVLDGAKSVVVIGAGYIGLEAAAVLTKLGKSVTVLEALERVLARVAGEEISRFYEAYHQAKGVDIKLNVQVEAIIGDEKAEGVRLADGTEIPADFVIVGIGINPEVAALNDAGAVSKCNGVFVNEYCQTSLEDIYAIGDCAAHENAFVDGGLVRLESVQNANDQARVAAKHICGVEEAYHAVPWFWSNQYDLRLQTVGVSSGHDQTVKRGDPDKGSFSVIYLKAGQVIALDCINAPKDYVQGKFLIAGNAKPSLDDLANPEIALKDLAQS